MDSIQSYSNTVYFKVDNQENGFVFQPEITAEGVYFNAYTEKGDSIIKLPFAEQLTVKGKNGIHHYSFKKY